MEINFHGNNSNVSEEYKEEKNILDSSEGLGSQEEPELIGADHRANTEEPSGFNFRKISQWFFYATVFLIPLFVLPFTASPLDYNKQIFLVVLSGGAAIFYLLDVIKTGTFKYRPSSFYLPMGVFIGFILLSSLFSVNKYVSLMGGFSNSSDSFIVWAFLAVLFVVGLNVIDDNGKRLKNVYIYSIAIALLLGVLQVLGLGVFNFLGSVGRSFNTVGSLNTLVMVAALSLPLFMSSSKSMTGFWKKVFDGSRFLALLVTLFLLVLINWWPLWITAFIVLVGWMVIRVFEMGRIRMNIFVMPLAIVVMGTFLMLIDLSLPLRSKIPTEINLSQKSSFSILKDSIKEKPLFGFGISNYGISYDKFKPQAIANTPFSQVRFNKATSEVLNIVTESGVSGLIGLLLFAWFLGVALFRRFRDMLKGSGTGNAYGIPLIVGVVVSAFLYPFNIVLSFLAVFTLLLFDIANPKSEEKVVELEGSPVLSLLGSVLFIVALVGVLTGGYFTANRYLASYHYANALEENNNDSKIERLVKAVNSDRNETFYPRELSQTIIAVLADQLNKEVDPAETQAHNAKIQNNIASAVDIAKRSTDINPTDARNWANRGFIYQNLMGLVGGSENIAIEMYKESLLRDPHNSLTYTRLGNTYLAIAENLTRTLNRTPRSDINTINQLREKINENLNKSVENYQKAVELNRSNGRAIYNMSAAFERMNNLKQAIAGLEVIRASSPRDPSIVFQLGLLYYRNNQKDAAFNAWQQAVSLFPDYSNARWYLSLMYEERGDIENALSQVREIERLNPGNELVQQRLQQLEEGRRIIPPGNVLDQEPL
ncbi:MAG: hypothetical protein COV29_00535 [Candidatus Yanofskybacteria bacterium CG10_big_fil_rev_8_21_14_0_10_36_16]|uniref:Uncharacterized protein n=1 Tax=Candidatus Yanofskybacteria bacterium CG10_big_fil_rev_8_21_14_0_10_36_16 TaxID=1975096 RepID=A0A2J0QB57_9BACT|nr:MAG: hypothetical protein COV29_00535 [Candidatus Yanofskybacteria bacterium CG10_big_fil_rev_8_21_14_0_10_36_16]